MKISKNDKVICFFLEGHIDTNNAPEVENEIMTVLDYEFEKVKSNASDGDGNMFPKVEIDAKNLVYISSAGLRVLLKVQKKINSVTGSGKNSMAIKVRVKNVSRDVYEIFETTGFSEILQVEKAYREVSVEGCKVIGVGFYGTVYRIDEETIIKVYKGKDSVPMIKNEQKMAKKALINGIPTAISYDIVKVGEDYGSVFELLNAKTLNDIVIEGEKPIEEIVHSYVDLLHLVHDTEMTDDEIPKSRDIFLGYVDAFSGYISEEMSADLKKFIGAIPEKNSVIHGDIQMKNVMLVDDEPMLIDMDTLSLGNPLYDLQGIYVTYKEFEEDEPGNTKSFLGIEGETADKIWELTIDYYFDFKDELEKSQTIAKIRLLAAIRFLFIVTASDLKNGELGERRISHTIEHMKELLEVVF